MTLEDYAVLINDEYGEYLIALTTLQRFKYLMDAELKEELDRVCKAELANCENTSRVVTKTETFTRTWTELEWD